jgi:cytochrome P450
MGAQVARLETVEILGALLRQTSVIALARPDHPIEYRNSLATRGPKHVHLRLTARSRNRPCAHGSAVAVDGGRGRN